MAFRLEEDLSCPICHDIFKDPVVLSCSHSFCKGCVSTWWRSKQKCECPVCKSVPRTRRPPLNLALRNLCEAFLEERDERESAKTFCSLHFEKFKLYCLTDQQPACVVCRDSRAHVNHTFRPIDELAQELREEIRECLVPVQTKLRTFKQVKQNFDQTAEHIKVQARRTEGQIKDKFGSLRRLLCKEEKARITALKKEARMKSLRMRKKIEALSREITALSDVIRETNMELRADDVLFLQSFNYAVGRVQRPLPNAPQPVPGALIDVARHLGNLTCPVWNKMKEMMSSYTPVILDPNTAHPHLVLSEDLTSVKYGKRQNLPPNPERIDYYRCVLGSQGFFSGTHSWDVEVGDSDHWLLGVASESAYRNRDLRSGLWVIKFWCDEYSASSPTKTVRIHEQKPKMKKIRVHLNWRRGKLSFSNSETDAHIHTFRHAFTDRMFPYFSNGKRSPLKILPETVSTRKTPEVMFMCLMMMMTVMMMMVLMMLFSGMTK